MQSLASRVEKLRRANSGGAGGASGETVRELSEEVRKCIGFTSGDERLWKRCASWETARVPFPCLHVQAAVVEGTHRSFKPMCLRYDVWRVLSANALASP
eukprot:scaffold92678_cov21-Tisochrysis_lutea.AAC.2